MPVPCLIEYTILNNIPFPINAKFESLTVTFLADIISQLGYFFNSKTNDV